MTHGRRSAAHLAAIVLTGLAAAAFAIAFRAAISFTVRHAFGASDILRGFESLPVVLRFALPTLGGLAAGAVAVVAARRGGGHGVSEVLEAVALGRGRISLRTTLWKSLGSYLAIVSGGSVGREGSIVQFGAGAGGAIGRRLGTTDKQVRALVAAGTAAGFAAAYNTPIAAILFVVEIVAGVAALDVIVPTIAATVIATATTRFALGGGPIYGVRTFTLASNLELIAYGAIGLLAGLLGPGFMAMLAAGERLVRAVPLSRPIRAALGGAVVGLLAMEFPEITGNGYETIGLILGGMFAAPLLLALVILKAVATTSSVSSGSPGGVFTPSLFLGAAVGGVVGQCLALFGTALPHGGSGGYALVGMAAMIAATTHAPIMASVLAFELSGDYAIVLPLFIATIGATVVARRLRPDSIYTEELTRRGIPWQGDIAQRLARGVRAADILEMDPPTVSSNAPLDDALALLAARRNRVVYVVGDGCVRAIDLHAAKDVWAAKRSETHSALQATAGDVASDVPSAAPDDSLLVLSEKLWNVDWGELPVIDPASPGRLAGIITRKAVLGAFDRELLQRDLLLTRVVWFEGQREAADYLELPRGQRVEVIAPPSWSIGNPVDTSEIRWRFRVAVLGVRHGTSQSTEWIDPIDDGVAKAGDRWLVVGQPAAISALQASTAGTNSHS